MTRRSPPVFALLLAAVLTGSDAADAARLTLPPVHRDRLPSGLTVIVVPAPRLPLVEVRALVRAGAADDPAGKEGLADLLADLLIRGAGRRSALQVAEDIAFVGGSLTSSAGPEHTVVHAEVLARDLDLALEIVSDAVAAPSLPDAEVSRARSEAVGDLASLADDPAAIANRAVWPVVFGATPLGHPPSGYRCTVEGITADDLRRFHRARFHPSRTIVAVVGDVDRKKALAAVRRTFGAWRGGAAPPPLPAADPVARPATAVHLVAVPGLTQAHLRLAAPSLPWSHGDIHALDVVSAILGGGFTSRLVERVRVSEGLTYQIHSEPRHLGRTGLFTISTFTRNDTLARCLDVTREVIRTFVQEGPTPEEVARAKRYLTGQQPLSLQAPSDLASQLVDAEAHGLPPSFLEDYAARIEAVTLADCRRVLNEHVRPGDLATIVVADPDAIAAARKALGEAATAAPDACPERGRR